MPTMVHMDALRQAKFRQMNFVDAEISDIVFRSCFQAGIPIEEGWI